MYYFKLFHDKDVLFLISVTLYKILFTIFIINTVYITYIFRYIGTIIIGIRRRRREKMTFLYVIETIINRLILWRCKVFRTLIFFDRKRGESKRKR